MIYVTFPELCAFSVAVVICGLMIGMFFGSL